MSEVSHGCYVGYAAIAPHHRILHSQDPHLLHRMVGVVERLLECSDYQESVRLLGGIPLLLGLLRYVRIMSMSMHAAYMYMSLANM